MIYSKLQNSDTTFLCSKYSDLAKRFSSYWAIPRLFCFCFFIVLIRIMVMLESLAFLVLHMSKEYNYICQMSSSNHVCLKSNCLAGFDLFTLNNSNTRTMCEICSKLTIKIGERCQWNGSVIYIVNFE